MRILLKEHGSILSDLVFSRAPIHIGSKPGSDVHLPDMRVDSEHAQLSPQPNGDWLLEHLAGNAETWVNGHRLVNATKVATGDQITIEDYTLNIYLEFDENQAGLQASSGEVLKVDEYPLPYGAVTRSKRDSLMMSCQSIDSVTQFALEISRCRDVSSVMESAISGLFQRFKARAVWLGLRRQARGPLQMIQGRDTSGRPCDKPEYYDSLVHRCVDRGLSVWVPQITDETIGSLMASPLSTSQGRLGLLYVDSKKGAEPLGERDFELLIALCSALGQQLDACFRNQVRYRQSMSAAESSIAQAIQAKLDPHLVPDWPELHVAVHCIPGSERAGDVYDIMQLPNGAAAFMLGRVHAESVVAGSIAMIEARTAFRMAVLHAEMPHVMMQELNWLLCAAAEKVQLQGAIVLVDPKNGALLHSLAGPAGALIVGQSGEPRPLQHAAAPVLGAAPNHPYATRKGLLGNKESLALYTPGIARARNEQGEELGERRFVDSLCDGFGMAARRALNETLSDLSPYLEDGYQPEDLTILLAHRQAATPA